MSETVGNVFWRKLKGDLPQAAKAEGVWLIDEKGKRYLDASGGAVVVNVGHGRQEIAQAVYEQMQKCYYAHPTMFGSQVVEDLAGALARHAPAGMERFYFLSGGGEAVETAIKLARQIHLTMGRPQKIRLISRWKSYHGLTLGALAAAGRTGFRTPFIPLLPEVVHIAPPYCLRCFYGLKYPGCGVRCALALEDVIQNLGAEVVSAFLGETISGATLAAYPPPPEYWPLIREICDRYEVLMIQDEVMVGMGRTGRWFASQHYQAVPDMITMGKGITSGSLALSAVGVQIRHFEAVRAGAGFTHGGTFTHHPVAAAAGLAVVGILEREKLVERAAALGERLGQSLKERLKNSPYVGDVRGKGMIWGVELVADKKTLKPFARKEQAAERVWQELFDNGVIVYRGVGLAGIDGDAFLVAPPFIITEKEIDLAVEKIGQAIERVLG